MAGAQERVLKRRVKSIQSTKKTTKAMELIAASRIVKAQQRIYAARPYIDAIDSIARDLSPLVPSANQINDTARPALFIVGADRGLCGAYNSNVLKAAEKILSLPEYNETKPLVVLVGKKIQARFRYEQTRFDEAHVGFTDAPSFENARQVSKTFLSLIVENEISLAKVVSTRFLSLASQKVEVRNLFPVEVSDEPPSAESADFELEPSAEQIWQSLLPQWIEAKLFLALLEASASEHAARQRAMKAATDNAEELIKNLRRVMNRARQDSITSEIMDIVGGAEALRSSSNQGGISTIRPEDAGFASTREDR